MLNVSAGPSSPWESSVIWRFVARAGQQLAWLVTLLLLLQACSSPAPAPVRDQSARPALNPGVHTVRRGDTLYSIAWQYGVTVNELVAWNHLTRPDVIVKGKKLRVKAPPKKSVAKRSRPKPVKRVKASKPKTRTVTARASRPKVSSSSPAVASRKAPVPSRQPQVSNNGRIIWKWPAKGRIIQRFDAKKVGSKGLNIAGSSGDPVRSAASGKVVYAGSGLSGLGRLIIIKHNNEYLSAYAHNRKLIAREGQLVQQGEIIARLGNSGTDRNELYFEIRKNGRPVNPMHYLPGR